MWDQSDRHDNRTDVLESLKLTHNTENGRLVDKKRDPERYRERDVNNLSLRWERHKVWTFWTTVVQYGQWRNMSVQYTVKVNVVEKGAWNISWNCWSICIDINFTVIILKIFTQFFATVSRIVDYGNSYSLYDSTCDKTWGFDIYMKACIESKVKIASQNFHNRYKYMKPKFS